MRARKAVMGTALAVAGAGLLAVALSAPPAWAQEDQEVLQTIIEKAREREALLASFDILVNREVILPDGTAKIGHERQVKSGQRLFWEQVRQGIPGPDGKQRDIVTRCATDGVFFRDMRTAPDGTVSGRTGEFYRRLALRHDISNIEQLAGTRLGWFEAPPSVVLEGDTRRLAVDYAGRRADMDTFKVRLVENRIIEGRDCVGVEVEFVWDDRQQVRTRIYFAPELNYAWTAFEENIVLNGQRTITRTVEEFREVRPGLFLPLSVRCRDSSGEMPFRDTITINAIESAEFLGNEVFTFEFPPGAQVEDQRGAQSRYDAEAVVEALVEPGLETPSDQTAAAELESGGRPVQPPEGAAVQMDEGAPREREGGHPFSRLVLAVLALVAAVAAIVVYRRRRKSE